MISKILTIVGYITLTVSMISLVGFLITYSDPALNTFGRITLGAMSFGLYLTIISLIRSETSDLFKKEKKASEFPYKDIKI